LVATITMVITGITKSRTIFLGVTHFSRPVYSSVKISQSTGTVAIPRYSNAAHASMPSSDRQDSSTP